MKALDEMIAINRTAEKLVLMRITPANAEAYDLAGKMVDIVRASQVTVREQWPALVGDPMAGNVVVLTRLVAMLPVLEAAIELYEDFEPDASFVPGSPLGRLFAAVRNYNLINTMPQPLNEDPTK